MQLSGQAHNKCIRCATDEQRGVYFSEDSTVGRLESDLVGNLEDIFCFYYKAHMAMHKCIPP